MHTQLIFAYLDLIKDFYQDKSINDIAINNNGSVWYMQDNQWVESTIVFPHENIYAIFLVLSKSEQKNLSALGHFEFNKWRISIALPPVTPKSAIMVIRKHSMECIPIEKFSFEEPKVYREEHYFSNLESLKEIVKQRKNIVISGETGSGKTSILSALTNGFRNNERSVILEEENQEIQTEKRNCIFLKSVNEFSLTKLLKFSLRCRPDRIIIGEIRGIEILPFLEACNTGHSGCLATIHANSAYETTERLEYLMSSCPETQSWTRERIRDSIFFNIDYIIHMRRGSIYPEISELVEIKKSKNYYKIRKIF